MPNVWENSDDIPEWLKKARAANRQKRFRENHPEHKQERKEYDSQRKNRSGTAIREKRHTGEHFVAIDAEGIDKGLPFYLDRHNNRKPICSADEWNNIPDKDRALILRKYKGQVIYKDQRTSLWMAGGLQGISNKTAVNLEGFTSEQIMAWLIELPDHFYDEIRDYLGVRRLEEQPVFIAFGFGYDVGQIVKDLPYEKRWELNAGKPYSERKNSRYIADLSSYPVLYKDYAMYYIPGKKFVLYKLADPNNPFFINSKGGKEINSCKKITIYDTFGFFQQKFTAALKGFPGAVSESEYKLIEDNKAKRGSFKSEDIEEIKTYTSLELKGLVNMLTSIRNSLLTAIEGKPLKLSQWYGAGAIATAALKAYLPGDEGREHIGASYMEDRELWKPENENSYGAWILRGYFGARIDLVKQGYHNGALYEYDVASAYPAQAAELPGMKDGYWEYIANPTREDVFNATAVGMFEVKTHNYATDLPFYALPYRTGSGSIMFPCCVHGYYMRDHVIAAFKHYDTFTATKRLMDYSLYGKGPEIELCGAWIFHPRNTVKPLAWIKDLFGYRLQLVMIDKKDSRGQVIKLCINAVYGKFAQRIGKRGEPPKYGSLWYAGAITAGTQRQLIEAALTKPDAIVAFATDGIYTTERLDVYVPKEKILGEWEMSRGDKGSFIQSGVYVVHLKDKEGKVEIKAKSRGFTPDKADRKEGETYTDVLDRTLTSSIPDHWANGNDEYAFDYQQYITVGMSVQSRKTSDLIGMWKIAPRVLNLNSMSNKRIVPGEPKKDAIKRQSKREGKTVREYEREIPKDFQFTQKETKLREGRAKKLIPLMVRHVLGHIEPSAPSLPTWLDERTKMERKEIEDIENVSAGMA